MSVMMKCGCASQTVRVMEDGSRVPSCFTHNTLEIAETVPDLSGRTARCTYRSCKQSLAKYRDTHYGALRDDGRSYAPSSIELPFFKSTPDKEYDEYFCGCMGWD